MERKARMKIAATLYRAIHDETGETYEGTAKELAEILHIVPGTVNKAALQYCKVAKHWTIKKIGHIVQNYPKNECKFPQELLEEWDAVTKPFKDASRGK